MKSFFKRTKPHSSGGGGGGGKRRLSKDAGAHPPAPVDRGVFNDDSIEWESSGGEGSPAGVKEFSEGSNPFQWISFEEVLHDSPMARERLRQSFTEVDEFVHSSGKIVKQMAEVSAMSNRYGSTMKKLAQMITALGGSNDHRNNATDMLLNTSTDGGSGGASQNPSRRSGSGIQSNNNKGRGTGEREGSKGLSEQEVDDEHGEKEETGDLDPSYHETLGTCATIFKELEEFRTLLIDQILSVFVRPLEDGLKEDFKAVKEEQKKYEKARNNYDNALAKMSGVNKKEAARSAELESELSAYRQQFEQSGLDYTCILNSIHTKQQIDFLDRMCTIMFSFMAFFQQGSVLFHDVEKKLNKFSEHVKMTKDTYEKEREGMCYLKVDLKQDRLMESIRPRGGGRHAHASTPSTPNPHGGAGTAPGGNGGTGGGGGNGGKGEDKPQPYLADVVGSKGGNYGYGRSRGRSFSDKAKENSAIASGGEGDGSAPRGSGGGGGGGRGEIISSVGASGAGAVGNAASGAGGGEDTFGTIVNESQTEIQGYLFKHGKNMMQPWRRRYFAIKDGVFYRYRASDDGQSKERTKAVSALNLSLCTVKSVEEGETDRRFCFNLISPQRTYLLQAENEKVMRLWFTVIQNAVSQALDKLKSGSSKGSRNQNPSNKGESDRAGGAGGAAGGAGEKTKSTLQSLQDHDPSNLKCADCRGANPTWASINLGAVICIECSGIHRSLGTHVTKVRSLTLDAWEVDQILVVKALGNAAVNAVYEAQLEQDSLYRIEESADRQARETFIINKYQYRKWVKFADSAPLSPKVAAGEYAYGEEAKSPLSSTGAGKDIAVGLEVDYPSPRKEGPVGKATPEAAEYRFVSPGPSPTTPTSSKDSSRASATLAPPGLLPTTMQGTPSKEKEGDGANGKKRHRGLSSIQGLKEKWSDLRHDETSGKEKEKEKEKEKDKEKGREKDKLKPEDANTGSRLPTIPRRIRSLSSTDQALIDRHLHKAVQENDIRAALLALARGARVEADGRKWTALHVAADKGYTTLAGWLYRKGANLDAVDASNNTAVDLAVAKQNADCVTLLRLAQLCAEEAKGAGPRGGKGSLHCSQETFLQALMSFSESIEEETKLNPEAEKKGGKSLLPAIIQETPIGERLRRTEEGKGGGDDSDDGDDDDDDGDVGEEATVFHAGNVAHLNECWDASDSSDNE